MTRCPKCGSHSIGGPSYRQDQFGEHLSYSCLRCGYEQTKPTLDAEERHPLTEWPKGGTPGGDRG